MGAGTVIQERAEPLKIPVAISVYMLIAFLISIPLYSGLSPNSLVEPFFWGMYAFWVILLTAMYFGLSAVRDRLMDN